MAIIVKFPDMNDREWREIEEALKKIMEETGASDEMVHNVCERTKQAFLKFNKRLTFDVNLPALSYVSQEDTETIRASIQEAVQRFADQVHQLMNEVLLDRVLLEIEIYQAKNESL